MDGGKMGRYRRISLFIITTLIVSVFLLCQKVYASSTTNEKSPFSFSVSLYKDKDIKTSSSLVKLKAEEVDVVYSELNKVSNQKEDLASYVASLKEQVASLDDMFVHIDKYAPDSGGNNYAWGNCTYYVKSKRPDISNSLGNANTWYSAAKSRGWKVGTKAKKGAIATSTGGWLGHVAYVEGVTPDGEWVTISEMNAPGFNVISSKTVRFSEFRYIYELS